MIIVVLNEKIYSTNTKKNFPKSWGNVLKKIFHQPPSGRPIYENFNKYFLKKRSFFLRF